MKFYTMVDLGGCKRNFTLDRSFFNLCWVRSFSFVLLKKMAKNVDCRPINFGYASAQNLWKEQDYIYGTKLLSRGFLLYTKKIGLTKVHVLLT